MKPRWFVYTPRLRFMWGIEGYVYSKPGSDWARYTWSQLTEAWRNIYPINRKRSATSNGVEIYFLATPEEVEVLSSLLEKRW